jgi:hypothetical protein
MYFCIEFSLVAQVGFIETEIFADSGEVVTFALSMSAPSSQHISVDIHCSPINSSGIPVH